MADENYLDVYRREANASLAGKGWAFSKVAHGPVGAVLELLDIIKILRETIDAMDRDMTAPDQYGGANQWAPEVASQIRHARRLTDGAEQTGIKMNIQGIDWAKARSAAARNALAEAQDAD